MASTGAIPRKKVYNTPASNTESHHLDSQILVGQDGSEPLDVKYLTVSRNGVQTRVPAIHKSWCEFRTLITYSPPPQGEGLLVEGALDAWLEQMDYYKEDLEWMLSLPHHRFWSHLIFERKIHTCLTSYLTQAPRSFEEISSNESPHYKQSILPILQDVHKLVLLVHMRMSTCKESKTCYISPSSFGDMIYRNYVVDVCQLMDLCALYGDSNSMLLSKMLSSIFTAQPNYLNDLKQAFISITSALNNIEGRFGAFDINGPLSLDAMSNTPKQTEVMDTIYYLLDTFYTLHNLLKVYPEAAVIFHEQELDVGISNCYERVVPALSQFVSNNFDSDETPSGSKLKDYLQQLRVTSLATFRIIVDHFCLQPILQQGDSSATACIEAYLRLFSSCLSDRTFIVDYHYIYDIKTDFAILKNNSKDATSLEYVEDAVNSILAEFDSNDSSEAAPPIYDNRTDECNNKDTSGMSRYAVLGSPHVDDVELTEMVSSVQDLMPDLGSGFISECLKHYHYSTESVINALLEGTLPPSLDKLDRALASVDLPSLTEQHPSQVKIEEPSRQLDNINKKELDAVQPSVLDRANIYNNDEFDVFSRPTINLDKVQRGKKKTDKLEDYDDVKEKVRAIGKLYEEHNGHSIYEDNYLESSEEETVYTAPANYDDEYDDTYNDNEVGNTDTITEVALPRFKKLGGRASIFGRGALNVPVGSASSSSNEGEGEEDSNPVLAVEETDDNFMQRRGLRKGLGGPQFMLELNQNNGSIKRNAPKYERNLPASHVHNVQRRKGQRRHKPVDYHRDHHKPLYVNTTSKEMQDDAPGDEAEACNEEAAGSEELVESPESAPVPPRDNYLRNGDNKFNKQEAVKNAPDVVRDAPHHNATGARPKMFTNKSGKSWRQNTADNQSRGSTGGKWKEDAPSLSSESLNYRRKTQNKNKDRKQAAQNKFYRNN